MKSNLEIKQEIINIIKKNIDKKTNELIWLPEIRQYYKSTYDILVIISEVKGK